MRNPNPENDYFRQWGLRTSYFIKEIAKLRDEFNFTLISSGGTDNIIDATKSLAIGSDMFALVRKILKTVHKSSVNGIVNLIEKWFDGIKKIMFLTGSASIADLQQNKTF